MRLARSLAAALVLAAPTVAQSTFDDVHPIFRARCGDCHSTQGNGAFDHANADIGFAYAQTQLASYFVSGQTKGFATLVRIQNGDMPLGAGCSGDPQVDAGDPACLTAVEQAAIQTWIQDGQLAPLAVRGAPFCFGDGSGTPCPCGNAGASDAGCANTVSFAGARLTAAGTASLAADTLVLRAQRMPNSSALYFQGTARVAAGAGTTFGDGLRCVGGAVLRLGTRSNAAAASQYPEQGDLPISIRGAIPGPGEPRHYQVWYRNAAAFCAPETFNLTNGVTVVWGS